VTGRGIVVLAIPPLRFLTTFWAKAMLGSAARRCFKPSKEGSLLSSSWRWCKCQRKMQEHTVEMGLVGVLC